MNPLKPGKHFRFQVQSRYNSNIFLFVLSENSENSLEQWFRTAVLTASHVVPHCKLVHLQFLKIDVNILKYLNHLDYFLTQFFSSGGLCHKTFSSRGSAAKFISILGSLARKERKLQKAFVKSATGLKKNPPLAERFQSCRKVE